MNEEQKIENKKVHFSKKPWVHSIAIIVCVFGVLGGFLFWQSTSGTVFIENSYLEAPVVNLSPSAPGTLNALYVKEGDTIAQNTQVAQVGSEIIVSKQGGVVSYAQNLIGQYFSPGQKVVSVVDTNDMQVVGSIDETGGLGNINSGDRATFTVDAFPGKSYQGVVANITPSSEDTGVVFSISDSRPVKKFDVKVNFSIADYPELRNGMSAKITVHTK